VIVTGPCERQGRKNGGVSAVALETKAVAERHDLAGLAEPGRREQVGCK